MTLPARVMLLLSVVAALCVSANLLTVLGLPYVTDGGTVAAKLHPATWLCALALLASAGNRRRRRDRGSALIMAYLAAMGFCLASETLLTGVGNLVILLDNYLPAGGLALLLCLPDPALDLRLRRTLQLCISGNVVLALGETACHQTLLPLFQGGVLSAQGAEFRPTALYDHPLTGALVTLIGTFLVPVCGWQRQGYSLLLGFGLIAFGGRAAVAAAVVCGVWFCMTSLWRVGWPRHVPMRSLLAMIGMVVLCLGAAGCAWFAGLGARLEAHLTWDASADVRLGQWQIFSMLDLEQILFGIPRSDLLALLEPMRLFHVVPTIENFWLLQYLSLGAFAFPVFAVGFSCLLLWCMRQARYRAKPMVISSVVVASTSVSLGHKSALLMILVAAAASLRSIPTSPTASKFRTADAPSLAGGS